MARYDHHREVGAYQQIHGGLPVPFEHRIEVGRVDADQIGGGAFVLEHQQLVARTGLESAPCLRLVVQDLQAWKPPHVQFAPVAH
ncbi:MAG: hypothetical protein R3E96_08350 [Planctomycetota bacterium]